MIRALGRILKATLVGGFFVLIPLLILVMVIDEVFGLLVALATPIADLYPGTVFDDLVSPPLVAALLLVGASLALGLLARIAFTRSVGSWAERMTIGRLPIYRVMKQLVGRIVVPDEAIAFRPALLDVGADEQTLVYAIEELDGDRLTVFVPFAPMGFTGTIRIVPAGKVRMLDASLADATRIIGQWGVDMRTLIKPG